MSVEDGSGSCQPFFSEGSDVDQKTGIIVKVNGYIKEGRL